MFRFVCSQGEEIAINGPYAHAAYQVAVITSGGPVPVYLKCIFCELRFDFPPRWIYLFMYFGVGGAQTLNQFDVDVRIGKPSADSFKQRRV